MTESNKSYPPVAEARLIGLFVCLTAVAVEHNHAPRNHSEGAIQQKSAWSEDEEDKLSRIWVPSDESQA